MQDVGHLGGSEVAGVGGCGLAAGLVCHGASLRTTDPDSDAGPSADRLSVRHRRQRPAAQAIASVPCLVLDEQNDYRDQTKHPAIACLDRFSAQVPRAADGDLSQDAAPAQLHPAGCQLEDAAQAEMLRPDSPARTAADPGAVRGCYLSLPLPGWSFPWPLGLPRPPSRSLLALPCCSSGRSADSAGWLPADVLPSVRVPEPTARDAGGWLLDGLAARAAPADALRCRHRRAWLGVLHGQTEDNPADGPQQRPHDHRN